MPESSRGLKKNKEENNNRIPPHHKAGWNNMYMSSKKLWFSGKDTYAELEDCFATYTDLSDVIHVLCTNPYAWLLSSFCFSNILEFHPEYLNYLQINKEIKAEYRRIVTVENSGCLLNSRGTVVKPCLHLNNSKKELVAMKKQRVGRSPARCGEVAEPLLGQT